MAGTEKGCDRAGQAADDAGAEGKGDELLEVPTGRLCLVGCSVGVLIVGLSFC